MKYTNVVRRDTLYEYWYIRQLHFNDFQIYNNLQNYTIRSKIPK